MNYGNAPELLGLLKDVDKRLGRTRPGRRQTIYLFGGAAAVIAYKAPRATMDLDVYLDDEDVSREVLAWAGPGSELERRHGVYVQHVNLTIMPIEDPDWRERCVEVLAGAFRCLRVMVVSKEDLILSKLGRYADKDRADIEYLAEECGADRRKLISYYESARLYYAGDLRELDATFQVVLREHFGPRRKT